jgi:hypothetical protein
MVNGQRFMVHEAAPRPLILLLSTDPVNEQTFISN